MLYVHFLNRQPVGDPARDPDHLHIMEIVSGLDVRPGINELSRPIKNRLLPPVPVIVR